MTRVVLVPGVLALLPEYAGIDDPVADLRAACGRAVAWLVGDGTPVTVVAGSQGRRVAEHLVRAAGGTVDGSVDGSVDGAADAPQVALVVGNGSARRTEKAPGHLDDRAAAYDEALGAALLGPDPAALRDLDPGLGAELLADVEGLRSLGALLGADAEVTVDYDDDPFGVQYWVVRWA